MQLKINSKKYFFALFFIGVIFTSKGQLLFTDLSDQYGFDDLGTNRGIAIGDYDSDGDDDIYISRQGQSNILYRNNGGGSFTDVSSSAGVDYDGATHASLWGDFNNDGHLDLYLGNRIEANILYQNNGDGTFTNVAEAAGVDYGGKPRAVLAADIDLDGLLDIYVANLIEENALYHNNGDGTFTNIIATSGASDPQLSMGAVFFDYDNDGDPDLYLTHDGNQPNILLQNDGTGNFTDVSVLSGTNYAGLGMGVDFGDINNDGWLDLYITNLAANTLYLNNGDGTFSDISDAAMVTDPGMGWGTTFLDFDNDGWQDIYMVNDSYFSPLPNILYRNNGDNTFEIVSENSPIASMYGSYGTACTDLDLDGKVEVFVTNSGNTDGNQIFKNETANTGNWFRLKTVGTISNYSAIGTKVTIETGESIYTDEVCGGSGYGSQNSLTLHFGLGDATLIDLLTIRWANGLVETYTDLMVNQSMTAIENQSLTVNTFSPATLDVGIKTFPNPVEAQLNIELSIEESKDVQVNILDINGKVVDHIFNGRLTEGNHTFQWDTKLISGVYFVNIVSEKAVKTSKVIVL